MFVKEQRFLAAAVEDERIAPLQADDGLAIPGLLREEKTDRVLLEWLGRGRADIDASRRQAGLRAEDAHEPDDRR